MFRDFGFSSYLELKPSFGVLSNLAIILLRKGELVTLFKCMHLCLCCRLGICVVFLFLAVTRIGLRSIIATFPGHTRLLLRC